MREKNIITPIIFVIFLVVISNLTTISIATQFDWALFVVSISLNIVGICIDFNVYKLTKNTSEVIKERYELYKIINDKEDRLSDVLGKIQSSRNHQILINIHIYAYDVMNSLENIENAILNHTLLLELKEKHIKRKKLKVIKNLLKFYNYTDDLEEIIRDYKSGDLIKKEKVNVIASVTGTIGFIITILGFFKFDYQSINISTNLVFVFIVFVINLIGSIESYFKTKKYYVRLYKKLQMIFNNEKIEMF